MLASIQRDAFILGGASEDALSADNPQSLDDLQASVDVYRGKTGREVVVTDGTGIAVAVSGDEARRGADYSTRPEIAAALAGNPTSGRRASTTLGGDIVYVAVPVLSGAQLVGVVRLTYPAATIDDRVSDKVRGILVVGLISLATTALAAALMATTIVRPLRRLQRATEQVAAGDFESRAVIDEGAPEIRGLATSFNTMTEKISTLVERQRSFAGDASHQLRTPLTALRLQLERAAVNVDTDPEAARGDIEAASEETERLQRLVEGLLMSARADQQGRCRRSIIDVADIVTERAAIWAPLADERGVTLTAGRIDTVSAQAVPGALEQIIDNYIDNALNAGAAGNEITVSVGGRPRLGNCPRDRSRSGHADRSAPARVRSVLAGIERTARRVRSRAWRSCVSSPKPAEARWLWPIEPTAGSTPAFAYPWPESRCVHDQAVQHHVEVTPRDAVVAVVSAGMMHRMMLLREHDAAPLRGGDQARHRRHVRPLVQLVGHDHAAHEGDEKDADVRVAR